MDEWMEVRIRYKKPDSDISEKIVHAITNQNITDNPSRDFRFASAVAEFGLILKDSQYKGDAALSSVKHLAEAAMGDDAEGYRSNFLELVNKVEALGLG